MLKHLITPCSLLAVCCAAAQVMPATDTLPKVDSAIIDMQVELRDPLPTIIVNDEDPEAGETTAISSVLTAGRDPFISAAAFSFSSMRFRLRGYETRGNTVYINGIDFNGLDNGFTPFGLWSGLNGSMRSQQQVYGVQASDFAFGAIALNTHIDMRASAQRVQTQLGYALSNRTYRHRLIFHHGSGFDKSGWAYSMALTGRYAREGYVAGTFYEGASYYLAVDKRVRKHLYSFIAFGAPTETGRQGPAVQEAMNLAGTNFYNPSWGYQNGKKRNANVLKVMQPVFMLVHDYRPDDKSNLFTSIAYLFGKRKNSALDWYNAPDPRPDYYRYLPGYYIKDQPGTYQLLKQLFESDPSALQIQWDKLYEANRGNLLTVNNAGGIAGNNVRGRRAVYILSNRVTDTKRVMANMVYRSKMGQKATLTIGANFQRQVNHYYQGVKDLLGADFWLNINQFAERDFPNSIDAMQYDLNRPDRIVRAGDLYGYNYRITINQAAAWAQLSWKLHHFDGFLAGEIAHTGFYRTGMNRNGLFPDISYGKSPKQAFTYPAVKAGITYKMNGRNYFFINAAARAMPPFFENAYMSQRTRSTVQEGLVKEMLISGEAGYKHNAPGLKLVFTGFYTKTKDGLDVFTFYHDQFQNFVNYALSGIDKVFFGAELGTEVKLTTVLSFKGAAAIGRYYYNSRQRAIVTADNSAAVLARQTIYLKNYRIPSTPQNAYSAGLFYRSPKYWYVSITGNYFNNLWLNPNPLRRTTDAVADASPENPSSDDLKKAILGQERFEGQFLLDFFGGWSRLLPRSFGISHKRTYLVFSLGVNNLLNANDIRSGGGEQMRFDFEGKDVEKFPPKYFYALGINYFASIGLRF